MFHISYCNSKCWVLKSCAFFVLFCFVSLCFWLLLLLLLLCLFVCLYCFVLFRFLFVCLFVCLFVFVFLFCFCFCFFLFFVFTFLFVFFCHRQATKTVFIGACIFSFDISCIFYALACEYTILKSGLK